MTRNEFIENMRGDLEFFKDCEERARERAEKFWLKYIKAKDDDERDCLLDNYKDEKTEQVIYRAKALLVESYIEMYK